MKEKVVFASPLPLHPLISIPSNTPLTRSPPSFSRQEPAAWREPRRDHAREKAKRSCVSEGKNSACSLPRHHACQKGKTVHAPSPDILSIEPTFHRTCAESMTRQSAEMPTSLSVLSVSTLQMNNVSYLCMISCRGSCLLVECYNCLHTNTTRLKMTLMMNHPPTPCLERQGVLRHEVEGVTVVSAERQ